MNSLKLCALVLWIIFGGANGKQCDDCVKYNECPEALKLAREDKSEATRQLFRTAFCGFDQTGKIVLVCCSVFSLPTLNSRSWQVVETDEDTRIANHENLKLLPETCGHVAIDRIVGGKFADMYEFPWMAIIMHTTRDGTEIKCGGSIINKRYILTAAHCVQNKILAGVRVGEYNIPEDIDCQKGVCESHLQDLPVEQAIVHEKYKGLPKVINDIALIRVANDINFTPKNVDPICLPKTSRLRQRPLANVIATVCGWGYTESDRTSDILLKVKIPIHPAENCSGLYNRYAWPGEPDATADQLCAGSQAKDSCNGDSGGPLIVEDIYDKPERYVQYGIVSHGPRKCGSDYPGVYTDVTKFMGWILDHISP